MTGCDDVGSHVADLAEDTVGRHRDFRALARFLRAHPLAVWLASSGKYTRCC